MHERGVGFADNHPDFKLILAAGVKNFVAFAGLCCTLAPQVFDLQKATHPYGRKPRSIGLPAGL